MPKQMPGTAKKKKRKRANKFIESQRDALNNYFSVDCYPNVSVAYYFYIILLFLLGKFKKTLIIFFYSHFIIFMSIETMRIN
jgi:hypothetical protein